MQKSPTPFHCLKTRGALSCNSMFIMIALGTVCCKDHLHNHIFIIAMIILSKFQIRAVNTPPSKNLVYSTQRIITDDLALTVGWVHGGEVRLRIGTYSKPIM